MLNDMNPIARLTSAARSVFYNLANFGAITAALLGFRGALSQSFSDAAYPEYKMLPERALRPGELRALLHVTPWVTGLDNECRALFYGHVQDLIATAHEKKSNPEAFLQPQEIADIIFQVTRRICILTEQVSDTGTIAEAICADISQRFCDMTNAELARASLDFATWRPAPGSLNPGR